MGNANTSDLQNSAIKNVAVQNSTSECYRLVHEPGNLVSEFDSGTEDSLGPGLEYSECIISGLNTSIENLSEGLSSESIVSEFERSDSGKLKSHKHCVKLNYSVMNTETTRRLI